jgi:integrase
MNHETATEARMMPPNFEDLGDIGPAPPDARLIYSVYYGYCDPLSELQRRDFLASLPKTPPPDGLRTPAKAGPMKYAAKDINKRVEQIRSGQPPELPEGKREQHYRDPALPGLYIRQLNTGAASWVVQWKRLGRQKKIALGNVLTLDRLEAIKAAKDLLAKVQLKTLDPHEARRERMRANKVTFATVAPLFLDDKIRKGEMRPSTAKSWKVYLITGYYLKSLHNLPIDEITSEQIQTLIDQIAIQSGNAAAVDCRAVMRVLFKWAFKTSKLPVDHHNPMANIQAPKKRGPRERVLTDDEIRSIWKACDAWEAEAIHTQQIKASTGKAPRPGLEPILDHPRAARLLFLTGCRSHEIGDLKRSEVDLDNGELKISGARTKNAVELFNPLADMAVQILRGIKQRPGNDSFFGRGDEAGLSLRHLVRDINVRIVKAGGTPVKHWTPHDIRRTFRTRLAALKVSMDVAEALLGHVGHRNQIERTYNRYDYWPEKRRALTMWEANLRAIIDGTAEKFSRPRFGERKKEDTA